MRLGIAPGSLGKVAVLAVRFLGDVAQADAQPVARRLAKLFNSQNKSEFVERKRGARVKYVGKLSRLTSQYFNYSF